MKKSIYKILFIVTIIVFLIIIIPLVLFTPAYVESNISVDTGTPTNDHQVRINEYKAQMISGLFIQFRGEITEPEVNTILENDSLPTYKLDYNIDNVSDKYYVMVDENKITAVRYELGKKENWTEPQLGIQKGNYYIIAVPEHVIHDKTFLEVLNKYNLQLKKSVWCHIRFGDYPLKAITEEHANELKHELEMNENVFSVVFEPVVE